jgi:hypothetical protein
MKTLSIWFILVLTIFWVTTVNAGIYTWIDENGVRHYGDSLPEDTEKAKLVYPEYQFDESADKQRSQQERKEINSLIREIEANDARDKAEAQKRAEEIERNRKPTQQELIAAEKARLEARIAFLEQQPLEYFGSQRNKIVRIGYYHYQMQELMEDPDKYFTQPASFEGNIKNPAENVSNHPSGAGGY